MVITAAASPLLALHLHPRLQQPVRAVHPVHVEPCIPATVHAQRCAPSSLQTAATPVSTAPAPPGDHVDREDPDASASDVAAIPRATGLAAGFALSRPSLTVRYPLHLTATGQ